jgi:hypothetical protein
MQDICVKFLYLPLDADAVYGVRKSMVIPIFDGVRILLDLLEFHLLVCQSIFLVCIISNHVRLLGNLGWGWMGSPRNNSNLDGATSLLYKCMICGTKERVSGNSPSVIL